MIIYLLKPGRQVGVYKILFLLILFVAGPEINAQRPVWKVNFLSFFDNTEFGGSAVKVPQTMSGVQLSPEAGLIADTVHRISAGVNLLHEFGSNEAVDRFYPTAYYELRKAPFTFIMGAFPRSMAVGDYSRLFFQDSITYYRPNVTGFSMRYLGNNGYLDFWLDWTGRQTREVHETFFLGISGKHSFGPLYLKHSDYMYHFARKLDPVIDESFHDNILSESVAGADFSGRTIFTKLDIDAGWVLGLERARSENTGWISMNGFIAEARIEYRFIGISDSFYKGSGLMYFYKDHGNEIYWGDPVYRSKTYNRSDMYIRFLRSRQVSIDLTYSLHFLESRIYHEQMLKVVVDLNNG